ncbi:MAG: 3-hydroxyacyl-ACP dehydratase FabZ [Deltaproteobacteria bacterium]|nr:3-hydroxyacyl-ACP dehydratase FabZ [Deltaproteobacteria bacterium]MBW2136196.1 3-hydroxyacyl-ACP dehydratase FabZ [Deltaproteobacteria bacterium]
MPTTYNVQDIMKYLPHRYPFLLVDRILELVPGERVVGLKNVTINEPFFQGHFPGSPIMPGVLILEAMAQTGGVLAYESLPSELHGAPVYFMAIDRVKFRRPVLPGDQLVFEVRFVRQRSKVIKLAGTSTVAEKRVAEAEFMATIGERP